MIRLELESGDYVEMEFEQLSSFDWSILLLLSLIYLEEEDPIKTFSLSEVRERYRDLENKDVSEETIEQSIEKLRHTRYVIKRGNLTEGVYAAAVSSLTLSGLSGKRVIYKFLAPPFLVHALCGTNREVRTHGQKVTE